MAHGQPKRILIVDDDPTTVHSYARVLRLEGYHVLTALNAEEAFLAVEASPPDAILLDLRMPNVDGFAFLRELRAGGAQMPVGVVTGIVDMDDQLEAELRKLNAVIRWKPLWLEDLVILAAALLGTRS